eukprot:TRINITY_DN14256_c0_g1_i1.p1 TRINITY_DN14256_c0_g1~~TRINITY_DN14256_c0_g1_i1.p1  ORF type:complete len:121 (+),score=10.64 TRINITY_DN14256_c0_g1_i1:154-516(+)
MGGLMPKLRGAVDVGIHGLERLGLAPFGASLERAVASLSQAMNFASSSAVLIAGKMVFVACLVIGFMPKLLTALHGALAFVCTTIMFCVVVWKSELTTCTTAAWCAAKNLLFFVTRSAAR